MILILSGTVGASTLTTVQLAEHKHSQGTGSKYQKGDTSVSVAVWDGEMSRTQKACTYSVGGSETHTHSMTDVSSSLTTTMPPYYSLSYIIRII